MKKLFSILLLLCSQLFSQAQNASILQNNTPLWVTLMDNPQANYFETLKEFKEFWKDKPLPKEPFEEGEMDTFEKEVGWISDKESEEKREKMEKRYHKKNNSNLSYAAEVRAFKGWMQTIKPWVLADGSIVTPQEQQSIIDRQQAELKLTEQNNKR